MRTLIFRAAIVAQEAIYSCGACTTQRRVSAKTQADLVYFAFFFFTAAAIIFFSAGTLTSESRLM